MRGSLGQLSTRRTKPACSTGRAADGKKNCDDGRVMRKRNGNVERFRGTEPAFLDGLHLASPEMQEVIRHKARWKGLRCPPPTVVEPDDFLTEGEVKGLLQRRVVPGTDYRRLRAIGLLLEAYRATDGEAGLTRSSVERELRWRKRSTRFCRLRREVRMVFGPLIGWWSYPPDT